LRDKLFILIFFLSGRMCMIIAIRIVFCKDSTSIAINIPFYFYVWRSRKSEPLEGPLEIKIDHIPISIFVSL